MKMLPADRMPEAEVTLRLAHALIKGGHAASDILVAIDGAQVKTGTTVHFPIVEFLRSLDWHSSATSDRWQTTYRNKSFSLSLVIHSSSGQGDLVTNLQSGNVLRVESKKGPLVRKGSSQEYPLIREAIGQLMTIEKADPDDILAVAVPFSKKFNSLAIRWRDRPLIRNAGIHIVTVDRENSIQGLEDYGIS